MARGSMCKSPKIPTVNSSAAAFKKVFLKGDDRSEVGIKAITADGVLLSSRNKKERTIVILSGRRIFVLCNFDVVPKKRRRSVSKNCDANASLAFEFPYPMEP
jgi:hypothetical protein